MLKHTFQHLHGIGEKTEKRLWANGITTWEEFLHAPEQTGLPSWLRDLACRELEQSLAALECHDAQYFSDRLAAAAQWRLYPEFGQRIGYLDIETTGLAVDASALTVIGIYDGMRPRVYVQGKNLADFVAAIAEFTLIVTYNGKGFDLPVLRRAFNLPLAHAHIDLRSPLATLGYKGGLKKIERAVGLEREGPLALLDGWGAVLLWQYYEAGEVEALDTLIRYNLEDVIHLPALLALVYNTRVRQLPFPVAPVHFPAPPPLPFEFSERLIYRALADMGRLENGEKKEVALANGDEQIR